MKADKIIIHCADTKPSMDIGFHEIDTWHKAKGWDGCGYHFIVRRDGEIETGRRLGVEGAHARGYNHNPGICLVGGMSEAGQPEANFTLDQYESLSMLIISIDKDLGGGLQVMGHRDLPGVTKACPCFDAYQLVSG